MKRKIVKEKYIAVFALATLLFIVGILVGHWISEWKIKKTLEVEKKLRFDLLSLELETEMLENYPCTIEAMMLEEELGNIARKVSFLEEQLGKRNPKVLELKKYYSLLEIRHYLLMKERKERCNENYTLILFFYSNLPENIEVSEKQGYVLDYLRDKYTTKKVKIYSLDYDLDLGIIKELIRIHNISEVPSLVIDGNLYVGFQSKEKLERILKGNK
ncbi:hypothetical protein B6U82_01335 [Candidatus Pacearchaeota archaeon ex4484_31]|nr:MAG: hypothetical protein B6U82_01335 [Candidatus Pacearchaeota archaeon ex4484_31]